MKRLDYRTIGALSNNPACFAIIRPMPPTGPQPPQKSLTEFVEELGTFPLEAFLFLHEGLAYTVHAIHGQRKSPAQNMHVTGQQLCHGLRDFALLKYGMLAHTVLSRWGIRSTDDFGTMVYSLIEAGLMGKTDTDSIDDFHHVYEFRTAFDARQYAIAELK